MTDLRLVKIGDAAKLLGVSISTLRTWEKTGDLMPAKKSRGGTRYYVRAHLLEVLDKK